MAVPGRHDPAVVPPALAGARVRAILAHEHIRHELIRSSISRAALEGEATTPAADRLLSGDPAPDRHQLLHRCHPAILRRPLVELAREVAHPLHGVGVLLPHSRSRGARKRCRAIAGNSVPAPDSLCPQDSKAPGKCSRTAPSFTPSLRHALKSCIGLRVYGIIRASHLLVFFVPTSNPLKSQGYARA